MRVARYTLAGELVAGKVEEIGDLIVKGKEALDLSRRFEPLHDPFSRLVGRCEFSAWLLSPLC